jgi:hypothetical protein
LQFDCTAKQQKKTQSITFCFVCGFFIWMRPFYFVSKRNSFWNDCMISFLFFLCFFFKFWTILFLITFDLLPCLVDLWLNVFVYVVVVVLFIRRHRWSFGLHCRYWRVR